MVQKPKRNHIVWRTKVEDFPLKMPSNFSFYWNRKKEIWTLRHYSGCCWNVKCSFLWVYGGYASAERTEKKTLHILNLGVDGISPYNGITMRLGKQKQAYTQTMDSFIFAINCKFAKSTCTHTLSHTHTGTI